MRHQLSHAFCYPVLSLVLVACASGQKPETQIAPTPPAVGKDADSTKSKALSQFPTTEDAEFRAHKPAPLARELKFDAPVPIERKLPNGLRVLVVENHRLPLVSIEVLIQTGHDGVPLTKTGLSDLVAAMLTEGTAKRSATEFAEALEDLASQLNASAEQSDFRIHLNSLVETLGPSTELLADAVIHPAFKIEDFERLRGLHLARLAQKKGLPSAIAADEMNRVLFGEQHPWGQPSGGTPQTVQSLTAADLRAFHRTYFHPNNAVIVVSGDVSAEDAVRLLGKYFASWRRGTIPRLKLSPFPDMKARTVTLVDKPATSQSQLWVGGRLFPANHPDATAIRVANNVLGGQFGSRLNLNLREDKAYSYGVRSSVVLGPTTGTWVASGGVVAKNTAEALFEFEKEITRFATGEITEDELAQAKILAIRRLPSQLETNDAVVTAINGLVADKLPLNYFATYPTKVQQLTKAEVGRAIAKHLKPSGWRIVVVGPRAENEEKIRNLGLGPLEIRSLEGKEFRALQSNASSKSGT
jgi:zinc protease